MCTVNKTKHNLTLPTKKLGKTAARVFIVEGHAWTAEELILANIGNMPKEELGDFVANLFSIEAGEGFHHLDDINCPSVDRVA